MTSLPYFHPAVSAWFERTFPAPTAAQAAAWPSIRSGQHTLIAAPTGDTPAGERDRMRRRPPHILVTTPESLYILLGSESGRRMLAPVRTVIIDEIHAVAPNKRGSH